MIPYFETGNKKIFISHWEKTYNYDSHFHNYLEFAYCFDGFQRVRCGTEVYTLAPGDCIVIFPNTVHEYIEYDQNIPTESISVICDTDLFTSVMPELSKMRPDYPIVAGENMPENAVLAFRKMTETQNSAELTGWAFIALAALCEQLALAPKTVQVTGKLAPKLIAYINENYQKPLTLKYLGKEFGYHPSYIAHVFCDQLKVPFRAYLDAVRSEVAADMIKSTDKNLTEISYECGFGSYNTFSRSFNIAFGQPPSVYRHSMAKQKKKSLR